jgi:cytosine permease
VTPSDQPVWPPTIQSALDAPAPPRRGWEWGLAPQLIGLFLWVAFFDQIPGEGLGRTALVWPVLGAAAGGLLSYLLLYRAPALWGVRARRPLAVVAARTFGTAGATWVPGAILTASNVVWIALAVAYATRLTIEGLERLGLLDPAFSRPLSAGPLATPGGLFLFTSLLWTIAATLTGRYLVRVIAALMQIYPVLPALLLGATAAVAMRGLPDYQVAVGRLGVPAAAWGAAALTAQMVFAFFSASALVCVDWGAAAVSEREARLGGWVGVAFASWVSATLALICVAGAFTRYGLPTPVSAGPAAARSLSFIPALKTLVGGGTSGLMLIGFSLVALAPACYSASAFGERLNLLRPNVSRLRWTLFAAAASWALAASGLLGRLLTVFGLMGALLAPAAGAMTADFVRSRGRWTHPRRGWNGPGVLGWAVGAAIGLVPVIAAAAGARGLARAQPAAVLAYLAAFLTYHALARLGSETPDETAIGPGPEEPPPAG